MNTQEKKYLAIINTGWGGGSWARDVNKSTAIERCAKITKSDWGHMLKIPETVKGMVYDVSGHDDIMWDDFGFHVKKSGDEKYEKIDVELLKPENFEYTYPKSRKRK